MKLFCSCLQQTLSRFEFGPIRRRVDEGVAFFRKHQIERAELEAKGVVEPKKSPRVYGVFTAVGYLLVPLSNIISLSYGLSILE